MAKTSLIIGATDSGGKTIQKTVTDVNPNATNEQLTTFGKMLNSLTNNTYQTTNRIDKTNCDTESGKTARTISYFSISGTQVPLANLAQPLTIPLSKLQTKAEGKYVVGMGYRDPSTATLGCRMPYFDDFSSSDYTTIGTYQSNWSSSLATANQGMYMVYICLDLNAAGSFTCTLKVDADETYTSLAVPLTFNVVDDTQGGE